MPIESKDLKVAVVAHPLRYWGGAQLHLLHLLEAFENVELYTAWADKAFVKEYFSKYKVYTSFLQWLPFKKRLNQELIPLLPYAYMSFNFKKYDLVIVVSDGFEKCIRIPKNVKYVLNVLTPPRFLWLNTRTIKSSTKFTFRLYHKLLEAPLHKYWRRLDQKYARKADLIISISAAVAQRVKSFWDKDSVVVFPPTRIEEISLNPEIKIREDWFLYLGGVETYKGVELAIRACIQLGKRLKVIGKGQDLDRMKALVNELNANNLIEFTGWYPDSEKSDYLNHCKAVILPAKDEDFGITYVEALAAGAPVVAYRGGGALDIVTESPRTGVFFDSYDVAGLVGAINSLDDYEFEPRVLRARAEFFSVKLFKERMLEAINGIIKG